MISQPKIELAILLKLFKHAEDGGDAETPEAIGRLFTIQIPGRRIDMSLQQLEARGEVERRYSRYHEDEGLWQISRAGYRTVEKALRNKNTFIARLNKDGDAWLETVEAQKAVLSNLPRYEQAPVAGGGAAAPPDHHDRGVQRRQSEWKAPAVVVAIAIGVVTLGAMFFLDYN